MTRVFLIRHGHVDNPYKLFYGPSIHLSNRGRRQIETLAQDFITADIQPTHIYSSPYVRTRETAEIFARHFPSIPITFVEDLKEWQVGDWYDKPLADFYAATGYDQNPTQTLPPDIEPLESCAQRIQSVIEEVARQHQDSTIFIVSHREPMVSALLSYQGRGWEPIHVFPFDFASSWELEFKDEILTSLKPRFDRSEME